MIPARTFPPGLDAIEVYDQSGFVSGPEIEERARQVQAELRNAHVSRVAVRVGCGSELVAILLACRPLAIELIIVSPWLPREAADAQRPDCWVRMEEQDGAVILEFDKCSKRTPTSIDTNVPGLTIFTSGSTGVPKASRRAWASLDHPSSMASRSERWGIGYSPSTFASVSATCQALGRARTIEYVQPTDFVTGRRGKTFDVVTGTPSFWRMSAIAARGGTAIPRRVNVATLGGEPVDRALLRLIRSVFIPARIKQIFGTTELGILISVDDELPGLPAALAGKRLPNGVAFDVKNDMLRFSVHPKAPFVKTGDTVKIDCGRIHVIGRVGQEINVGGHKVDPIYVSQVINQNPEVLGARAYSVASPVLGSVIGIDVVPRSECDPEEFAAEIKSYAKLCLAPPERPCRVRVTDRLSLAPSGKISFDG
jgi:acyl-coenzyme A synthetase/AMP-(fatty) acid ligase